MKKSYIVDSTCNDMRLDRWLRLKIGKIPQGLVEKYLRTGKIKLNRKKVKSSFKLKTNDEINIFHIEFKETINNSKIDLFFLQGTVVSTEHLGMEGKETLNIKDLCQSMNVPVIAGNCVTYEVAKLLMNAGVAGLMVGIGPGAACTSRGVLGIGIPQATAIADCSAARDDYFKESGRYIPIIGDGGIVTGGDICKCLACGADAVMIGSPIAKSSNAPGKGFHWGMATPSPVLPRGTRIEVGSTGSLERIIKGPALLDDGTHNLFGAIRTSMSTLGAKNIKEMQEVEIVIAPSLLTEGKVYQKAQQLGMGK